MGPASHCKAWSIKWEPRHTTVKWVLYTLNSWRVLTFSNIPMNLDFGLFY